MARTTIFAAGALSLLLDGTGGTARADEPATVDTGPQVHSLFEKNICFSHNSRDWRCDWLFPDLASRLHGGEQSTQAERSVVAPNSQRQDSGSAAPRRESGSSAEPSTKSSGDRKSSINLCFWDLSPAPPCTIDIPAVPAPPGDRAASSAS